jgi:RES domain-containing protein
VTGINFEDQPSGRANALPLLSAIAFKDTRRLIPSMYSPNEESVLTRLAPQMDVLRDLFQIESRTDDRLEAELGLLPGIGPQELVINVPYASVINAAFTHARPNGSRFNGPFRGAWYAAKSIQTAQAEAAYHAIVALSEVGRFKDEATYDEYLADFTGQFHDLQNSRKFAAALDPASYKVSQTLGQTLLKIGSLGLVYPSVRHKGGVCLVCFRPVIVAHVRKGRTFRFRWAGTPHPSIMQVSGRQK